jgi:hypothetical protein
MASKGAAWRNLDRQLADPSLFDRLLEQEEEAESVPFRLGGERKAASPTQSRQSGSGRWGRAVAANHGYARSLAWQAFRTSITSLLGFSKGFPDDHMLAAAVAGWQKAQGGLKVDGIIGPKTLKRMYVALRSTSPSPATAGGSEVSLHKMSADPGELRRVQRELGLEAEDAEDFSTDPIPGISDGHTNLTRQIANFLHLKPEDIEALVAGSKKPDKDFPVTDPKTLPRALDECEQRRHALRGRLCQEVGAALQDARKHLTNLYNKALATGGSAQFGLIGEALHLIQDSYSPAHAERDQLMGPPYLGAIRYIRVYNPVSPGHPLEHGFPADIRDRLDLLSSVGVAVSTATREFLQMVLGHIANPGAPGNQAQFVAFMNRHLRLSSANLTLAAIIRAAETSYDWADPRHFSYAACLAPDRPKAC